MVGDITNSEGGGLDEAVRASGYRVSKQEEERFLETIERCRQEDAGERRADEEDDEEEEEEEIDESDGHGEGDADDDDDDDDAGPWEEREDGKEGGTGTKAKK